MEHCKDNPSKLASTKCVYVIQYGKTYVERSGWDCQKYTITQTTYDINHAYKYVTEKGAIYMAEVLHRYLAPGAANLKVIRVNTTEEHSVVATFENKLLPINTLQPSDAIELIDAYESVSRTYGSSQNKEFAAIYRDYVYGRIKYDEFRKRVVDSDLKN